MKKKTILIGTVHMEVGGIEKTLLGLLKRIDYSKYEEVYTTADEAKKRDEYLASFDGGVLSSGSHKVRGTCIVRTSSTLTATQQKELEAAIVEALTKID